MLPCFAVRYLTKVHGDNDSAASRHQSIGIRAKSILRKIGTARFHPLFLHKILDVISNFHSVPRTLNHEFVFWRILCIDKY